MGRSTSSCLKIITCGRDSSDRDDLPATPLPAENKGSNDKRGWSFRKRSARHRVLSNTVSTETPSAANKESPETTNLNLQPADISPVLEKVSVIQCTDEKPLLSNAAELKVSETVVVTKDESDTDVPLEESVVIVIQAAVRGFLAQRELLKLRNVVKVQAAVRGHLVRQHAVGTLRCVQAIVKMQALVRARRARLLLEGFYIEKQLDGKHDVAISKTLEKDNVLTKPNVTCASIEKLLSNKFAQQLMEATPKNKPIHIKCDSTKPNSAWNWLERWMSVSSAKPTPQPELKAEQLEVERSGELVAVETKIQSECLGESVDPERNTNDVVVLSESKENLATYEAENFKFEACRPTSNSVGDDLEQPLPEKVITSDADETLISIEDKALQSDQNSQISGTSLPHNPEIEEQPEQPKRSMKRLAPEQLETEGKKFVYGSIKASNPAFIAVQSKFEELSSTANSNKSFSSLSQDVGVESNMDTFSSGLDTVTRTKELNVSENSGPYNSKLQYGGSECGTELSITSTLDSPDISEGGAAEYEHEAKVSEEELSDLKRTKDEDVETKDASNDPDTSIDYVSKSSEPVMGNLGIANCETETSTIVADVPQVELKQEQCTSEIELKPERSTSDIQKELKSEAVGPTHRSSPEASPRSHITVPESYGTPSSEVSVKTRMKGCTNQKRKSLAAGKRSPSNQNLDSGARSSVEQLPKDQKSGKRRNSFGSTRPDNIDQEPRESSSSSSLPHFMQATESARAKVNANNSPRSSPDVLDRDFAKKRHSLPGANGRQGSPRIQRSMSQAQPGAKGNGIVHEKKWQR